MFEETFGNEASKKALGNKASKPGGWIFIKEVAEANSAVLEMWGLKFSTDVVGT